MNSVTLSINLDRCSSMSTIRKDKHKVTLFCYSGWPCRWSSAYKSRAKHSDMPYPVRNHHKKYVKVLGSYYLYLSGIENIIAYNTHNIM